VNGVHGYAIFRNGIKISGVTIGTTSFRDLGLAPSTTYQYRIVARDGRGNESAQSSPISVTTASAPTPPADTVAPSVPTGLIAQCVTSSRINLSWNPSTDNVGVQGYLVIRSGVQVGTVPVGSTSYYDIGLSSGVAYHYQLRAIDGRGNVSSLSNTNTTGTCSG
jgi:chitodextrinase